MLTETKEKTLPESEAFNIAAELLLDVIDRAVIHLVATQVRGDMDSVTSIEVSVTARDKDKKVIGDSKRTMTLDEGENNA